MEAAKRPAAVRETGSSRGPLLGALLLGALLCSGALGCGSGEDSPGPATEGEAARPPQASAPGFRTVSLPLAEGVRPYRAAIGDLNGDGLGDFVVCGASPGGGSVRVYLARPDGEYRTHDLSVPPTPRDVVLADLDADGDLDLATANTVPASLNVFFGDGAGGFTPGQPPLPLPRRPYALASGDVDGDGTMDLAGAAEGGHLAVFFGDGRGKFPSRTYLPSHPGPSDVALGDVDGDGDLDLVIPLSRDTRVAIYLNEGERTFGDARRLTLPTRRPYSVALSDLDGDERLDLVVPDLDGGPLYVRRGAGDGTFTSGLRLPGAPGVRDVVVTDLDADGRPDVVATASRTNRVLLYYGRSDGPFEEGAGRFAAPEALQAGSSPEATAAGDLNGDDLPDLVTVNSGSQDVTLFLSEPERRVAVAEVQEPPESDPAAMAQVSNVYEDALAAYRSGDIEGARTSLERIMEAGEPLFRRGVLQPDQSHPGWVRFNAALLLLADLYRYRTEEPSLARDLERALAEEAERQGHLQVAAIQWLAVGEIEEQSLGDGEAASAAYERVLQFGGQAKGPPSLILDLAREALDRLHAADPGYESRLQRVQLPYPGNVFNEVNEVAGFVFPHVKGYSDSSNPIEAQREFADAHPDSFRASFTEYAAILLSSVFPGTGSHPVELSEQFVQRYPDSLLSFIVDGHILRLLHGGVGQDEEYQRILERAQDRARRLGIELEVAFERKGA